MLIGIAYDKYITARAKYLSAQSNVTHRQKQHKQRKLGVPPTETLEQIRVAKENVETNRILVRTALVVLMEAVDETLHEYD